MNGLDTSQPKVIGGIIVIALVLGVALAIATAHVLMGLTTLYWDILWAPWLPDQTRKIALGAGAVTFVGFIGAVFLRRPLPDVHGKARFATDQEIQRNGLRAAEGIIVGRKGGSLLRFGGPEHVVVYAPTRSGKGVGVVIPNLLSWTGSVIVLDVKKENWAITSGLRARAGQKVFLFDPGDPSGCTHRYNPLGFARLTDRLMINDLQNIANILFPAEGKKEPFWDLSAQKLFVAVAGTIAVMSDRPLTLGEIFRVMTTAPKFQSMLAVWGGEASDDPRWQPVKALLNDLAGMSETVFGSVFATATSVLSPYGTNALLDAATSANDFDLTRLRQQEMSIYVGVTPDMFKQLAPLTRLLFEQATNLTVAGGLPGPSDHSVLLLLDEFTAPGPLPAIAHGFGFFAGYNLRMLLIVQSPSQLETTYDRTGRDTIMSNCGVEIVYPPKELKDAKELSERIGFHGVEARSRSTPLAWMSRRSSGSESVSEQRRAVLLPQELMQLDRNKLLLLRAGMPAVMGDKIYYYKEKVFKERLVPALAVGTVMAGTPEGGSEASSSSAPDQQPTSQPQATVTFTDDELLERKPVPDWRLRPALHDQIQPKEQMTGDEGDAWAGQYVGEVIRVQADVARAF